MSTPAIGSRQLEIRFSSANGALLLDQDIYGDNNGQRIDYRYVADASGAVTITTTPTGANSTHIYGFCNREATALPPNPWSYTAWTDNSNTAVNNDAVYTHAYNFGSATSPLINGVTFTGIAGTNPTAANFTTTNFGAFFNGDTNNVAGSGSGMATDFVYGGNPGQLSLTGLVPGKEYLLSLFSVAFDAPGARFIYFTGPDGTRLIDQGTFDNNNGIRIDYRYVANSLGTVQITTAPMVVNQSFHLYGFANREVTFSAHLQILTQPESAYVTAVGAPATFTVFADGGQPLSYQWRKGTTNITGANSTSYTINSVSASDVGTYSVVVTGTGNQGSVTSNNASLILATDPVPGLFNTGVGVDGNGLSDGAADPHYLLLFNPDGSASIPALVQSSTEFPIVTGPWLANTATSKWIGPRLNTAQAAGQWIVPPDVNAVPPVVGVPRDAGAGQGTYAYRITVDLTGFDPASVRIQGGWTSDNEGVTIKVNGTTTGVVGPGTFTALTQFTLTNANAPFSTGINTIDFYVRNADVTNGYTGLRVVDIKGFGIIAPGTPPHIAVQPAATVANKFTLATLAVAASGSASLSYQWYKDNVLLPAETASSLSTFIDSATPVGSYYVKVTNSAGFANSTPALLTVANSLPITVIDGASLAKNGTTSFLSDALLANDSDPDLDFLTLTGVSAASTGGGTVSLSFGTITYKPALNFTGTDSFTYTVNDGWGGIATGTAQFAVLSGPIPRPGQLVFSASPNLTALRFSGISGTSYTFQRSVDLLFWDDIFTQAAPPTGILDFTDPTQGSVPKAFFRVRKN